MCSLCLGGTSQADQVKNSGWYFPQKLEASYTCKRVLTSFSFQRVLSTATYLLYVGLLIRVIQNGKNGAIASTWEFRDDLGIFCLLLVVCGFISTVSVFFLP